LLICQFENEASNQHLQIGKSSNQYIIKSAHFQIFKSLIFKSSNRSSSNLQIDTSSNHQIAHLQIFKSTHLQIIKSLIFKSSNQHIFKSSNHQIKKLFF